MGSKVTVDSDYSHEIKRSFLLEEKVMINLAYLKAETSLLIKICIVKAMVFPVVVYGCESWTIKMASAKELIILNCGAGEDS